MLVGGLKEPHANNITLAGGITGPLKTLKNRKFDWGKPVLV